MTAPRLDLGGGNAVEVTGKTGKPGDWGLIWYHLRRDTGTPCSGCLSWDPEDPKHWDLQQREPLTLSPSLLCTACGAHGFIRNGRWEGC